MKTGLCLVLTLGLASCSAVFPPAEAMSWTRPYLQADFRVGEKVWAPWPDRLRVYLGTVRGWERGAYRVVFPTGDVGFFLAEELRAVRLLRGELILCYDGTDYVPARLVGLGQVLDVELEDGSQRQATLVALPRSQAAWPEPMP